MACSLCDLGSGGVTECGTTTNTACCVSDANRKVALESGSCAASCHVGSPVGGSGCEACANYAVTYTEVPCTETVDATCAACAILPGAGFVSEGPCVYSGHFRLWVTSQERPPPLRYQM